MVGSKWGLQTVKADTFCTVDGLYLKDGEPYCFFEVKKRNINLGRIPSVFIDKAKLDRAYRGAQHWECNLVLIFEFDDGLFYCSIKEPPAFETQIGGPKTERDAYDRDEVYLIPRSSWKNL